MLSFSLDKPVLVWLTIIAYALFASIIACYLFFKGVQKVPSIHSGLIYLLEIVVGILLDVIFLDTKLSCNIIIGGMLIITANVFLIIKCSKRENN